MTRRLFLSQRSPFARKVRILLAEKQLPYEQVLVDLSARTPQFEALSPLGKVPVLMEDDGTLVFDSTVIAEYLEDRYPDPPMLGRGFAERLQHRAVDELADTISDQAVALFFGKDTGAALEKHEVLLRRALDELARRVRGGDVPQTFGLGQAAVIAAMDYLAFRHGSAHTASRPELERFVARHRSRRSVELAAAPSG